VVAEVHVDVVEKQIRVSKIWCVQDSGLVINPDQVENQIMGNIIWGCSMVLKEEITFDAGMVEQRNFDTYEILRHDETPEMVIELTPSNEVPSAVGESAFAPVVPAITNAIFNASGIRVRNLPLREEHFISTRKS
jgi:isoquinoline 1-oxidoreductase beta subunit